MDDRVRTCRDIMLYYLDEYAAFGEKCILNKPFCFKTMLLAKKAAKMVVNAHNVYHIALEIASGQEKEMPQDEDDLLYASRSAQRMPAARAGIPPEKH